MDPLLDDGYGIVQSLLSAPLDPAGAETRGHRTGRQRQECDHSGGHRGEAECRDEPAQTEDPRRPDRQCPVLARSLRAPGHPTFE